MGLREMLEGGRRVRRQIQQSRSVESPNYLKAQEKGCGEDGLRNTLESVVTRPRNQLDDV